jgi:hypothetical protein
MKTAFKDLESPYFDGELKSVVPTDALRQSLGRSIGESLFARFGAQRRVTEPSQPYEEYGTTPGIQAVEADVLGDIEPEWANEEPGEDGTQKSDLILAGEASPLDRDDVRNRRDVEAVSEAEDKPTGGSVPSGADTKQSLSVTVILDQPGESDDEFQLVGSSYSKTLGASDAKQLVAGEKVLRFDAIKPQKSYKLIHMRSKKSTYVVLEACPTATEGEGHHHPLGNVTGPSRPERLATDLSRGKCFAD